MSKAFLQIAIDISKIERAIREQRFALEDVIRHVEKKRRPWLIHHIGERMLKRKWKEFKDVQ